MHITAVLDPDPDPDPLVRGMDPDPSNIKGLVAVCHSFCIYISLYNTLTTVDTFIQSYILHS
jgi:hypothetical protein